MTDEEIRKKYINLVIKNNFIKQEKSKSISLYKMSKKRGIRLRKNIKRKGSEF